MSNQLHSALPKKARAALFDIDAQQAARIRGWFRALYAGQVNHNAVAAVLHVEISAVEIKRIK